MTHPSPILSSPLTFPSFPFPYTSPPRMLFLTRPSQLTIMLERSLVQPLSLRLPSLQPSNTPLSHPPQLSMYAGADAVVTVSEHDASWVRRHVRRDMRREARSLPAKLVPTPPRPLVVRPLPFVAYPPPPNRVAGWGERSGLLFIGVAHTSAAQSMRWFLREVLRRLESLL